MTSCDWRRRLQNGMQIIIKSVQELSLFVSAVLFRISLILSLLLSELDAASPMLTKLKLVKRCIHRSAYAFATGFIGWIGKRLEIYNLVEKQHFTGFLLWIQWLTKLNLMSVNVYLSNLKTSCKWKWYIYIYIYIIYQYSRQ